MKIKKINIIFICFVLSILGISYVQAQEIPQDKATSVLAFRLGYGLDIPGGDLKDRFGFNFKITSGVEYITNSNFTFGLDLNYLFGSKVKEDPISSLRIDNGLVLGIDNEYADIFLRERGVFAGVTVGKIIPLKNKTSKTGLKFTLSSGIFQHYIRILDDKRSVPQFSGSYLKGFDRLTRGFGLKEFIGYQVLSQDNRMTFHVGLEFTQGFTSRVRDIDFNDGSSDDSGRVDLGFGIKVAWILPFYTNLVPEEIFY